MSGAVLGGGPEDRSPLLLSGAGRFLAPTAAIFAVACLTATTLLGVLNGTSAFFLPEAAGAVGWAARIGAGLGLAAAVPAFLVAFHLARRGSIHGAAVSIHAGLLILILSCVLPAAAPLAWLLFPPLIILSFVVLGLAHGAVMTLVGAATFLFVDSTSQGGLADLMAQPWPSVLPVVAAFSGVAAVGVLFHAILRRALLAEQRQRHQISETSKVLEYQERLLHHALRVETAAEAAGMVVHQLRNQFQVMIGHAAVGELASDDEKQERFRKIQEGVAGSRALLDQLLDLSHPHESPKKDVDLGVACANFVANTRRMLPSRVRFVADITSLNLPVSLDPGGLEQALLNLVINACDAIVGVGDLMLKVGPADPGKVEISVADTGPGIPEDQLDGIWEPYFTTKPRGKGTGLGLPSVKRFVESHDGTIELESTTGEGTKFKLTFPLATVQREDSSEILAAPTS